MSKRHFTAAIVLLFFLTMLFFPKTVFLGASKGLLLWFQIVLPTLLPYMILINLMLHTPALHLICRMTSPFLCPILHTSYYGTFAVLTGFLCGYPMGAKTLSDLLRLQKISRTEAAYLLSFCNNTSPAFILSYVVIQNLKNATLSVPFLMILILTPLLMSFFFRLFYPLSDTYNLSCAPFLESSGHTTLSGQNVQHTSISPETGFFDSCIMNAFESITKIGGYMILFSAGVQLLSMLFPDSVPFLIFCSSLEISTGIQLIVSSVSDRTLKILLCGALTSFGGWCCMAQTHSMISGVHLPFLPYTAEKLATALVTSLLLYAYIYAI